MSFTDDFFKELEKKKKKKQDDIAPVSSSNNYTDNFYAELREREDEIDSRDMDRNSITFSRQEYEDDIAPVKGGNKDSVFKSGGFSDGVDGVGDFFGDLGQTVLGTIADLSVGITKGVGNLAEGIFDLGTYAVAGVSDLIGQDDFAQKAKGFAQKNLVNDELKHADWVDEYSVLGNKADAVSEGLGQVAGIILTGGLGGAAGLSSAGVSALTTGTMFASGMGSGMSEAYSSGASDAEAVGYGATVGTVEAVSEMIFGGLGKGVKALGLSKGLTSVDDVLAKKISNAAAKFITSEAGQKVVGNTLEYAVKSGAEGLEEVISGFGTAIAKDAFLLNGEDEKAFNEILKDENLLEQFVVGSIVSGIAQGGDLIKSTANGRDFVSGLSTNEQTVLDKVYENALAEKEADGTKLSAKEKNKLYDDIVERMKKGYIDTDTIESVLGGETYKGYKNLTEQENSLNSKKSAIEDEIKSLVKTPEAQFTVEQREKLTSLRNEAKSIKEQINALDTKSAKSNLFNEVNKLTKSDTYLQESYNEKARKGQAFEADLTKYTGKQKEAVERAINSGVLNNTNRSHELVDVLSKIEADKGITFDYTNNAKLKESGFAVEGKTVNGFEKDGNVTLNVQSSKAWQSTVGHEITHVIEGTGDFYNALQSALFEYAESKGEYQSKYDTLAKLYKGIKGYETDFDTKIKKELTADLVGDYLFTDKDFINHLTGNRNLFQKIYDEIKYLCKVATGKELTEIEKVKRTFDEAWKEMSVKTNATNEAKTDANTARGHSTKPESGLRYSISETTDGRIAAVVDSDILSNIDTTSWDNTKKEMAKRAASDALKRFSDGIVVDGVTRKVNKRSRNEYTRSNYTEKLYRESPEMFADKMRAADIADDIVVATTNWKRDGGLEHPRDDNFVDFDHGTTLIMSGDAKYISEVVVGITQNGDAVFYDVVDMTPTTFDIKEAETSTTATTQDAIGDIQEISADGIISQSEENVNTKFSVSADSDGKQLSKEQGDRKRVVNQFEELKFSLSNEGEQFAPLGNYSTPLSETALEQDIAPFVTDTNDGHKTADDIAEDAAPATEAPSPDEISPMAEEEANALQDEKTRADAKLEGEPKSRKQLHNNIINDIKATFSSSGFEFDDVLSKAKDLSTFATVDNTPQRVMEKALGYKEGRVLSDLTVNKVAQNETEGIKWLNSFTDRKNGLLAELSKQYNIKPGSKESAAAQMYAEGFYVNDNEDIIAYGDAELAKDFPDARVQNNIKGLANDPRIRQIYDETLEAINASRMRNAYPEIQRLDNYFLHFRAMDDTFSRLGLPFNPNDIRAKDLPTDLNGVTADLKPGQPYFASAMHRKGKRTSFDLLGGLERYLTSAKNQIYHIDDIQTLRALRNYIADTYGQAKGLESIDMLTEEEAQERIKEVYGSHLSTFAKFLNEEANVLAGKTALIDRGLEGVIGRRGMTFLDTVRKQTGSNMVGFNISSSLTNFLPVAQTLAKSNKFDFLKAFAQTTSNKFGSIFGKGDNFAENSPVMIRRKGADRFYRTPFQKVGDAGYVLMGAVDNISTELIARTKFNELTRKGMDEQTAHFETDKWVSRLMGDRSLGQQPQLYNSKTLGVLTKFQLEVRNQLDSQFYDTIQETKVSNEHIENALARNAKIAAKVTSTFVQLAVAQHLFGKAFESVAGYNPAFDIISTLATMFGLDDDEESEDTVLDNVEQGFLELLEDLPYTSAFTGGRIPISSALPIAELIKGVDSYGNEKSRLETLGEALPYYVLPGGYGQIKKTAQGLGMFSDDHPVSGSYTASGNLRFPVEDTPLNRVQAALFGQYASENAREYFDEGYAPLKEKQIQEYIDVDIPIKDYWEYREGLNDLAPLPGKSSVTLEQKVDYINSLNLPVNKKNILVNNISNRKDPIDMTGYGDFSSLDEFDFATKYPDKYALSKAVGGYSAYKTYSDELYDIKSDKDAYGKTISGSRKEKVMQYINGLNADYETKIILYKAEYPSDDTYNMEIINYINNREDLTYEERVAIFAELGFTVSNGSVYWD